MNAVRAAVTAPAGPQTFSFTAKYTERPVDVIIIRDGATRQEPFNTQINAATLTLAARLWNLGNVHVGVFDHWFPRPVPPPAGTPAPAPAPGPAPAPALTSATPIVEPPPPAPTGTSTATATAAPDPILDASKVSATAFGTALQARIAAAGARGGTYLPAATLMDLLAESKKAGGGLVAGLLRPEAYWTVVYMGATLNPDDPYDVGDVSTAFKSQLGNFQVSALAIDEGGCVVVGTNPPMVINPNKAPQRNLELKLQQATQGIFASLCTNQTYSIFADDIVNSGTGTTYFTVALPTAVDPKSIKISAGGVDVPLFRYTAGALSLEVSTLVTSGEAFTVTAVPVGAPAAVTVGAPGKLDNVPAIGNTPASPAQLAFLKDVQPSLSKACSPCHGGKQGGFNSDSFTSALQNKTEVARRINLPLADGSHMPQAIDLKGTDMATFTAINTWASAP